MAEQDERDPPDDDAEADLYLDIDSQTPVDVDEVTREALAAVSGRAAVAKEKASDPPSGAEASAETAVAELQAELADLRDRSIRTLADFENYRRRSDREREDLRKFAAGDVLRDVLPVVDNLQRALAAGGSVEDLKVGVELTLKQFIDLLRQRGVVEVPAMGAPFDPAVHEAVARVDDASVATPTVVDELQRGYTLNGKLLRPALVRVAMPAEKWDKRN
jgi:molecular chaperone GrpE